MELGRQRRITEDFFIKKSKEYRVKQKELQSKIDKLNMADEEYYMSAEYVLKLANCAYDLFKSSEVHEKRQILKMLLQNLTLKGKTVDYDLIKPFDKIFFFASRQQWLPREDSNLQPSPYTYPKVSFRGGLYHHPK